MERIEEIEGLIKNLYERAKDKIAQDLNVYRIFQFNISDAGDFYIEINYGKINFVRGMHQNPTAILSTDYDTLIKILKKELDAMTAFLRGKLRISKDVLSTMLLRKIIESA
jgi:putative sterol carrier protein